MLPVLRVNYVLSATASHMMIVPLLVLCTSHLTVGQLVQSEGSQVVAALVGVGHGLECFSSMFQESLLVSKQNSDAITAVGKLPEMILELKKDLEGLKKASMEDSLKVEKYFQENKNLSTQLACDNKSLEQLEQELKTTREENEKNVVKVKQLEQSHQTMTKLNEKYVTRVAQLQRELEATSTENEQRIREMLQLVLETEKLKQQLESKSKEVNKLNTQINANLIFVEQLTLKKQLEQYNVNKDWSSLKSSVEAVLDHSSVAYLQLGNVSKDESSAMWKISFKGYTELAVVLLSAGLGANLADKDGDTLLHGAVQGGHVRLAEILLDYGADTEARGWKNSTPITRLDGNQQLVMLKLLVEHGADVNGMRSDGSSSLHWAAFYGNLDAVKYLVDEGSKTTAKDDNGMTPLAIAQKRGHRAVVEYLLQLPH